LIAGHVAGSVEQQAADPAERVFAVEKIALIQLRVRARCVDGAADGRIAEKIRVVARQGR
jgi:hypothetical protein